MAINDWRPSQHPVWWTYPSYNPWVMPPRPPAPSCPNCGRCPHCGQVAAPYTCTTNVVGAQAA